MEILSLKKVFSYIAALVVLTTATLVFAYPSYPNRVRDPKVNTPIEARYDRNHDGWINRRERRQMRRARVYRHRAYVCDFNRNGRIDSRREKRCL